MSQVCTTHVPAAVKKGGLDIHVTSSHLVNSVECSRCGYEMSDLIAFDALVGTFPQVPVRVSNIGEHHTKETHVLKLKRDSEKTGYGFGVGTTGDGDMLITEASAELVRWCLRCYVKNTSFAAL